jgi:NADPH:quinone reductase-like Zn-dependent oxidoreductase
MGLCIHTVSTATCPIARCDRASGELLRWWEDGKLKPLIAKTFPLAEAGAALDALVSRRYGGKVVLAT